MKPFPIPVVAVGPGTQEAGEEDTLSYLEMPKDMNRFSMPALPDPELVRDRVEAREAMRWLVEATAGWLPGAENPRFDAGVLDAANREVLDQVLGEGEVSMIIAGATAEETEIRGQESLFTGVWRVREFGADGSLRRDLIEVGPIPAVVLEAARGRATTTVAECAAPADAFSAPPVLEEIAHRAATRQPGDPTHVINLSLLPMSPSDGTHLGRVLAAGPVRILSRGYGNCRITSTVVRDTWWVQYVNGYGNPMVDSIEVTDIPDVAVASPEDIAESSSRLREALDWLENG
jgi:hydrogenase-1 operon protein HyaF